MGKEVTITWEDTLLENTTYIISFGNSITDFTEGNVNDKFKYVFSTGDFIDSLEVRGNVIDKEGKAVKEIMVALYDWNSLKEADSIPYKNLPTYYTYTDENGHFTLTNLKYSDFHVIAFQDIRQNFMLNSGSEQIGFLNDTLTTQTQNEPIKISLFIPEGQKRFYGAKHSGFGQIEVSYSYPLENFKVESISPAQDSTATLTTINQSKDTARFWFDPTSYQDSISLLISDMTGPKDTVTVNFREFDKENFTIKIPSTNLRKNDPITLNCGAPIIGIDTVKILAVANGDTFGVQVIDTIHPGRSIHLIPQKYPKDITLHIPAASISTLGGRVNDSLITSLKTLTRDELGSLDFIVKADSTEFPLILRIYTDSGKKVHESSFRNNTKVSFTNHFAGTYKAEIVLDIDANGKWSTGDYLKRLQPEKVIYYNEPIEIRANWELELEWQVQLD